MSVSDESPVGTVPADSNCPADLVRLGAQVDELRERLSAVGAEFQRVCTEKDAEIQRLLGEKAREIALRDQEIALLKAQADHLVRRLTRWSRRRQRLVKRPLGTVIGWLTPRR